MALKQEEDDKFNQYVMLVKLNGRANWKFVGEMEADSPDAAVMGIARQNLDMHNPSVEIEDVLNNLRRFSRWRVIQIAKDDDGELQEFSRGELGLNE